MLIIHPPPNGDRPAPGRSPCLQGKAQAAAVDFASVEWASATPGMVQLDALEEIPEDVPEKSYLGPAF